MALAVKKSYTLLLITGSAGRNNILDHLSAGRNDILGHLGAGRNEKYIGFSITLTITRMMLLCYSLGMVQVFLRVFYRASPSENSQEKLHHPM